MHDSEKQEKILGKIEKVDGLFKTKCWKWLRPWRARGYGELHFKGKRYRAHWFSYEAFNGPIPDRHGCAKRATMCGASTPIISSLSFIQGRAIEEIESLQNHR